MCGGNRYFIRSAQRQPGYQKEEAQLAPGLPMNSNEFVIRF
jgi:hypothetical protein